MKFVDIFMEKWNGLCVKLRPTVASAKEFMAAASKNMTGAWNYILKFRKVFLAVPVGVMAVILAIRNMAKLPVIVGLDLQASGEFSIQIIREVAVLGPMAVTALCLLLMFISKRTLTPWLVSILSLTLPLLILLTNTFPA